MTAPHYNGQSDPRLQAIAEAERLRYRNGNGHDHTPAEAPEPLVCKPLTVRSMTAIAPRAWAYGDFLLFGAASVIGAVDGGGKGVQAVAIALSMKHRLGGSTAWTAPFPAKPPGMWSKTYARQWRRYLEAEARARFTSDNTSSRK